MADVDRGQLILLTGLVIAIGFVALSLLLNMAIFTENLASRGTDTGAADALEFRQVSVDTVRTLIEEENAEKHLTQDAVYRNVTNGTETYDEITSTRYAKASTVADLSNLAVHNGTVIRQNTSDRDFVDSTDAINWTVVSDVEATREFKINVTDLNATADPGAEAFRITLVNGSDTWSLYVFNGPSESHLRVKNASGGLSGDVCEAATPTGPPFIVNLTAGTVDGTPCSAIEFGKGVTAPYDIEYTWGNRSEGTFNLTVNSTSLGGVEDYRAGQPFSIPVVYSVAFDITYRTDQLHYRQRVRITPGETI